MTEPGDGGGRTGATYGNFVIGSELGRGGMGIVFKAEHPVLQEPAVVKVLLKEFTSNESVRVRFVNEARSARKLTHENIVKVYDCGQATTGELYIALEFLDGVPLSKWLEGKSNAGVARMQSGRGLPISPVQIVRILIQVASPLHYAHEYRADGMDGIVHRDVKPDNVFLIARPARGRQPADDLFPKLLDFGIAKLREPGGGLTRPGSVIGTPSFMAPEQIDKADQVDRRADVWALGVMLYIMLTGGWHPFADANGNVPDFAELYRLQTSLPPPDPRARNGAISPALAEVVRRALACDPRERWSSALEFARALAEALPEQNGEPSGNELLRKYAEDLWDPNDPMLGRRLTTPPAGVDDARLWTPPPSAVSIVAAGAFAPPASTPTRSLGPPYVGVPQTTLGSSAAQSVAAPAKPAKSRKRLYGGVAAVAAVGLVAIAIAAGSTGGRATPETKAATDSARGVGGVPAVQGATNTPLTPVAILTEPSGAYVFIDDELVGTSPHKATLAAGRLIRVRVEHSGHVVSEETHVVGDRPETMRLTLSVLPDAGPPIDAAPPIDARTTARNPPGGRRPPSGDGPKAGSGSGSGSSWTFDPDGIAE